MTRNPGKPRISVKRLEKRYDLGGPVPFTPARSIYNRLAGRRYAIGASGSPGVWIDEEELEEEEEVEEVLEGPDAQPAAGVERDYAIRDVSFELGPGVVAGLLGGPGAGKTTLIRVLAGVSVPTAGKATLRGIVVPPPQLLSTFMRPDLSAGQNLRLAARLFGIPRRAVRERTDAILDFAAMHRRTPVDPRGAGDAFRRLGMAIAIAVGPDVLLLDEIPRLADEDYASRFVEALGGLAAGGTTVLFATRSERAVSALCDQVLRLREGHLDEGGPEADLARSDAEPAGPSENAARALPRPEATGEMIARRELRPGGRTHPLLPPGKPGWPGIGFHQWAALLSVHVRDASGAEVTRIAPDEELVVDFGIETGVRALQVHWRVSFLAENGADISVEEEAPRRYAERTISEVTARIAPGTLRPGTFVGRVEGLISAAGRTYTMRRDAFALVVDGDADEARRGLESVGPVVADSSASSWSVRGVPSPDRLLTHDEPIFRH